jgi:hypothetical protein
MIDRQTAEHIWGTRHRSYPQVADIDRQPSGIWEITYVDGSTEKFAMGSKRYIEFMSSVHDVEAHDITIEEAEFGKIIVRFKSVLPESSVKILKNGEDEWRPLWLIVEYQAERPLAN